MCTTRSGYIRYPLCRDYPWSFKENEFGTRIRRYLPGFCSQIKYGLGFILCGEGQDFIFWHGGHNLPGYGNLLVVMPEKEQGIAIMINDEQGTGLTAEIFYSFAQAYGWVRS